MRRALVGIGATAAGLVAVGAWWRRHPRTGAAYVNRVVDPWLVRRGIVDWADGEIGLIEHVGRRSGVARLTPVHPVATSNGFRIVVPLGVESQWAQNVLAAGHCRIQIGGTVHELDEPALIEASEVDEIPPLVARVMTWLGFRYLRLHRYAEHPGDLAGQAAALPESATEETSIEPDQLAATATT